MTGLSYKFQVAWQVAAAAVTLGIFFLILKPFLTYHSMWVVGVTSLASSIYIVFTQPTSLSAKFRSMLGCYVLAFIVGIFLHGMVSMLLPVPLSNYSNIWHAYLYDIMGMVSLVIVLSVSAYAKIPHPPAAGMALIITLRVDSWWLILVLFVCVLLLAGIHRLLRKKMVDL